MKQFFKKKQEINVEEQEDKKQNIRWMGRFLKRHKGITCVVVIIIIGSMVGCMIYHKQQKASGFPTEGSKGYETAVLTKRDISTSISVTGTVAAATTKTITTTLNNIKEDTTRNNNSNLAQQESSLESAKLQSFTSTNNDESQVKSLQEQVDSCVVTAPMSGVITALNTVWNP